MRTPKTTHRLCVLLVLTLLGVSEVEAQGGAPPSTVSRVTVAAQVDAVLVSWDPVTDPDGIDYYTIYYSHASILKGNGKFEDFEKTNDASTSFTLRDLIQRGFKPGDSVFVTVLATDRSGAQSPSFTTEASATLPGGGSIPPPSPSVPPPSAGPTLLRAVSEGATRVILYFSEEVVFPDQGASTLSIRDDVTQQVLPLLSVSIEGARAILATAGQTARARYIVTVTDVVKSKGGTPILPPGNSVAFIAREEAMPSTPPPPLPPTSPSPPAPPGAPATPPPPPPPSFALPPTPSRDTTPPEDPTDLNLRKTLQMNGHYTVAVSWRESVNSAKDFAQYALYESRDDGKTFAGPVAVAATIVSAKLTDVAPGILTVKVTARDATGNESPGIVRSIVLPDTGPEFVLLLSLVGAGVGTALRRRRRR